MSAQPGTCAVAFKEWSGVCDALLQGRQSIIVRKGGIHEGPGPGVFIPEHTEFWLYPTAVHQAQQGLRHGDGGEPAAAGGAGHSVPIRALAEVEWIASLTDEAGLPALDEFHIFTAETIRKRFHYRTPGLWILGVRIRRRDPAWTIPVTPAQAGCKTWVSLEEPLPTSGLVPVLDAATWAERLARLKSVLSARRP